MYFNVPIIIVFCTLYHVTIGKQRDFGFFLEEVEILVFPRNRGTICVDSHMEGGFCDEKEM